MPAGFQSATEEQKLRRIAEMMGVAEAKVHLKERLKGRRLELKGLSEGEVVSLFVGNVMAPDSAGWLQGYDFIVRPFSLHLFRLYPRAGSLRVPPDFGEWKVVDTGTINGNPAFKLERQGDMAQRRIGFFDSERYVPREKAMVVIRYDEGLAEVRGPFELAKDLGEVIRRSLKLDDANLIVLNENQYRRLLDNLQAAFDKIIYGASAGSAAEISVKMRAGHTIEVGTAVAFEMGPQNGAGAERVEDTSLQRNAGWASITLGTRQIKAQISRTRGTFNTNALLSELEVNAIVSAYKLATGLGVGGTAAD